MDNIFSDIKSTMGNAVKKSGELLEITKVKISIGETKTKLDEKYKELGEKIYTAKKEETDLTSDFEAIIWQIDELYEVLKNQELKLASLKNEKMCSNCNKNNIDTAVFCSHCGTKFEEEMEEEEEDTVEEE